MRISWGYWNDFCDRLAIGEINREIAARQRSGSGPVTRHRQKCSRARSSNVTLTSKRSSRIGYPRASCLGPKPCTGCLFVGPDVKAGHGLTRVLS